MAYEPVPFEQGRLVSLAEVKAMLLLAQHSREDLTYEQKLALEHSLRFARLNVKDSEKLIKDLQKIGEITPEYAYKLADLCPVESDDVRAIFAKSRMTIGDAQVSEIIETILKYYTPDDD